MKPHPSRLLRANHTAMRAAGGGALAPRRAGPGAVIVLVTGMGLASCARNARLDTRVEQVSASLAEAERHGAMRCAPRELATARSQLEFARLEREQGDAAQSAAHLDVADGNVRAARLLSAPERCGGAPDALPALDVVAPPPP